MEIWVAVVPLAALAIPATATVVIARMALKETTSQERAGILRAIAEIVRELHP